MDTECCTDWPGPDAPEEQRKKAEKALVIASERLRKLTASAWGLCEVVVRPCRTPCSPYEPYVPWEARGLYGNSSGPLDPFVWQGQVRNRMCGCAEECSCGPVCRTTLPGPVAEVLAVKVDGIKLDPAAYRVTSPPDNWLVRVDGGPCWPECQDMMLDDDEPGTFSVRYLLGRDPAEDYDAIHAVSVLACELYRNLCGQKCRIGGRVRSIQRDGISYDLVDSWPRKGTGLDEVDDWLSLVNPTGRLSRPAVYTPDLPQHRFWDCGS